MVSPPSATGPQSLKHLCQGGSGGSILGSGWLITGASPFRRWPLAVTEGSDWPLWYMGVWQCGPLHAVKYKKLSYRRETARQLPTWMEGVGARPPAHWPVWLLAIPVRMVESESQNVRTSSVPSIKRTLRWIGHSRSFKVILIGAGRNPEWSVVVMCN